MDRIRKLPLEGHQAALWFLGQAGYVLRSPEVTVVIDPYLSDSAAAEFQECTRLLPVPIDPTSLSADIYLVTHDHLDHLDPETIAAYRYQATTTFVAPRLAARRLVEVGVAESRIRIVDVGGSVEISGVQVTGVFALPSGTDVLDTCGYRIEFANRRTVYHTSDTGFTELLLEGAPKDVDVLLLPINGKWRNLNVEQACQLTEVIRPKYVLPNHYDMMAINSENPETFRFCLERRGTAAQCVIPTIMEPFVWE